MTPKSVTFNELCQQIELMQKGAVEWNDESKSVTVYLNNEPVTPSNINVGGRVVATGNITYPVLKVFPGDIGTVTRIIRESGVMYIACDKDPQAYTAIKYWPDDNPPWEVERLGNNE